MTFNIEKLGWNILLASTLAVAAAGIANASDDCDPNIYACDYSERYASALKNAQSRIEKERNDYYSWKVSCEYDQFTDVNTCTAKTNGMGEDGKKIIVQDSDKRFNRTLRVVWNNKMQKNTRFVCINGQNFAGHKATFRVDSNKVKSGTDQQCFVANSGFINQMKAGDKLYVTYNNFPYRDYRTVIDLTGFTAAYNELTAAVGAAK